MPYALLPTADTVTRDVVLRGILNSFPPGLNMSPGSNWYKLAEAWADSDFRVIQQIASMQQELNPGTSTVAKVLPAWERAVVDEKCANIPGLTEAQRQNLVVSSIKGGVRGLTATQVQNDLNNNFTGLGAVVTEHFPQRVNDPVDASRFRIGSRVGDYTWLQIGIPNYDPSTALHEQVNCRLAATLPVSTVYWVYNSN